MSLLWPWSVSSLDQTSFSRSGLALHSCSKPTEHQGGCPLGLKYLKKASNLHISYCWDSYHQPPSQSHPTCDDSTLEGQFWRAWDLSGVGKWRMIRKKYWNTSQWVSVLAQPLPIDNSGTALALSFLAQKPVCGIQKCCCLVAVACNKCKIRVHGYRWLLPSLNSLGWVIK